MSAELETWPRSHLVEGGGEPYLDYAVFGDIVLTAPLVRRSYRSDGVPEGVTLQQHGPGAELDRHRSGPAWDRLETERPDLAEEISWCRQGVMLRGTPANSRTLNYLRDAVGMIAYLLDQGGCAVYDSLARRWWSPAEWKQIIFEPAQSVPRRHVETLVSDDKLPHTKWYRTHGMRKFGRPDISVHHVTEPIEPDIIDLCERLIVLQSQGAVIRNGHSITINSIQTHITFKHAGSLDDPEFKNRYLEVRIKSPAD